MKRRTPARPCPTALLLFLSGILVSGAGSRAVAQSAPFPHPDGSTHWYEAIPVPTGISWSDARAAAARAGGYLATVTSAAENAFVFALADRAELWSLTGTGESRGPWLGGIQHPNSREPDQGFAWCELETMGYTAFSPGQPDDDANADRIHFGGTNTGRTATWGDAPASALLRGFVVEFSGPTAPRTVGLRRRDPGSFDGYTLLYPFRMREAALLDPRGRKVHSWISDTVNGVAYVEETGHLLRTGVLPNPSFPAGGGAGLVEELDWNGQRLWKFELANQIEQQHHDVARLPNGNVLLIAWHWVSTAAAIDAGRDPLKLTANGFWPDKIIEIRPHGGGAKVVWEWSAWDHLIQDFDASKPNHGVVRNHPERVDVNYIQSGHPDWMHTNALHYDAKLDQIMLSVREYSELWIIDHSTTTAEARTSNGGRSGKGGDLLYRWGNPEAYRAGDIGDQRLFHQHDCHWIPDGLPGGGNILVFNNGSLRTWSSVDEIVPPTADKDGNYPRTTANTWGPAKAVWTYQAPDLQSFYSSFISGCQRLPNGNTLICSGAEGRTFEVTSQGATVWEYENPVVGVAPLLHGTVPAGNYMFRSPRYAPSYPGLAGRGLPPQEPVERYSEALLIEGSTADHRTSIGSSVRFTLHTSTPLTEERFYQLATSATAGVTPIGWRDVRLACDALCLASATNSAPGVFQGYFGRFDHEGKAAAALVIPAIPQLIGAKLYTAFVVIDPPTAAAGTISNTVVLAIEP